jgi:hypothetical protein
MGFSLKHEASGHESGAPGNQNGHHSLGSLTRLGGKVGSIKLLVPRVGVSRDVDLRLARLADFLGVQWTPILLGRKTNDFAGYLDGVAKAEPGALVVNPAVLKEWTGGQLPGDLVKCLTSQFPFLFVHNLFPDPFCNALVQALSFGRVQSVEFIGSNNKPYRVASDSRDVCGSFSGISFGPANFRNDCVLKRGTDGPSLRVLVSIADRPFMAAVESSGTRIFFVGGRDVADLSEDVSDAPMSAFFSRLVPQAMALRSIFGEECWHPLGQYATFIVDDALLQPKHGFLEFQKLLELMDAHKFSTSIGFIPRNHRRSQKETARLFTDHSDRLSICIHGNDHTALEFASTDVARTNTSARVAEMRMRLHKKLTEVGYGKVMVFPYEEFSIPSINVLKAHNFLCAINSNASPVGQRAPFTISDLAQPAVMKFGGFPLFLRKFIESVKEEDLALALFFGRPIFISEHHEIFRHPEKLIRIVSMIHRLAPGIRWTDPASAVTQTCLRRKMSDGTYVIRAYCSNVRIVNDGKSPMRFNLEWNYPPGSPPIELILRDEAVQRDFEVTGSAIRLTGEVASGQALTYSVRYQNELPSLKRLGIVWNTKALLHRRYSELRDSYARSPFAMKITRALHQAVFSNRRVDRYDVRVLYSKTSDAVSRSHGDFPPA